MDELSLRNLEVSLIGLSELETGGQGITYTENRLKEYLILAIETILKIHEETELLKEKIQKLDCLRED